MDVSGLGVSELLGAFIGFGLTIMVFSYVFGDNLLFRIAIYVFIGVSAGYAVVIAVFNVILPQLLASFSSGETTQILSIIILLVASVMLFAKLSPRFTMIGTPVMAYLVGVGAAAAIGDALLGTLGGAEMPGEMATWSTCPTRYERMEKRFPHMVPWLKSQSGSLPGSSHTRYPQHPPANSFWSRSF